MKTKIDPNVERLMDQLLKTTKSTWGAGFDLLGPDLQSAVLSERLVILADQQDESTDPAVIVKIVRQGRSWIIDYVSKECV